MKDTDQQRLKKFSKHLLECKTHSKQLPKDLLELQDYLRQLTVYVDKYNRIKDNLAGQNVATPRAATDQAKYSEKRDYPYREMGFAVKEEMGESSAVQIIEMTPPEEVIVISENEKNVKEEVEGDFASLISNPEGETVLDPASDDSEIGIYFIEDVKPVNFINIIQRELCTLAKLFPNVDDIIKEITKEFEHFKVCCKCLKKVLPLLPEILQKLQELIKFVKKKRKEVYVWPNDSDYLRKTPEAVSKPFKKEVKESNKKKPREETVGFVTVYTNTPRIVRETEASIKGEPAARKHSEYVRKCSVRMSNRQQMTILQSKTQSDVRYLEKAETVEKETPLPEKRNEFNENSFFTELSTAQIYKTLNPLPIFQTVLQYKVGGNIEYAEKEMDPVEDSCSKFVTSDPVEVDVGKRFDQSLAAKAKELLLTTKLALRKACLELRTNNENCGKMENVLKTDVKSLKSMMLEVHENQIELSEVLLEKEVANPEIFQLTDPQMLQEEKEGVQKVQSSLAEENLDNTTLEDLQYLVDKLKSTCKAKNRSILATLNELQGRAPSQQCYGSTDHDLHHSQAQLQSEDITGLSKKSSLTFIEPEKVLVRQEWNICTKIQSNFNEIVTERKTRDARHSARISFSEIISKKSKCLHTLEQTTGKESLLTTKSFTMKDLNVETKKLIKDLENEVNSLTFEHNKILCEIEGLKRQKQATDHINASKSNRPASATIHLTIKIGEQDLINRCQSALTVAPSGATLTEKKSQMSLPVNTDKASQDPAARHSAVKLSPGLYFSEDELRKNHNAVKKPTKSLTNLALKLKLPILFQDEEKQDGASTGILSNPSEPKRDGFPDSGMTDTDAAPRFTNISDFYFKNDTHLNHSSNEEISDTQSVNGLCNFEFASHLKPHMKVHCEQNQTISKLRSRLRFLEDDLISLHMTIDRMDILTEKLIDDAYESSANFKHVWNRVRFITSRLDI